MATKDDDKKQEPEITPVGPGADEEEVHEESDEREVSSKAAGEDDDDEDDERVGRSEDDDEDDESGDRRGRLKSKRRHERKRRRERDKNNRVELNFLRNRNEQLERRFSEVDTRLEQNDIGHIDTRIGTLDQQIADAERVHAEAINQKNGAAATEALQIRDQLRDSKAQLTSQKSQRVQSSRQRQQQGQQPQIDPVVARNLEDWMSDNDWFDRNLTDEDSRIARAIEDTLYAEGRLNARDPEYWEEFNRRLAKRGLGSKARRNGRGRDEEDDEDQDDDDEEAEERPVKKRQAKGPRITTGGRERPLRKNEVYISPERRKAMEDAGVWEKPELRNKYLRQYASYDKEHRGDRRR
jgi:hypothetical protein